MVFCSVVNLSEVKVFLLVVKILFQILMNAIATMVDVLSRVKTMTEVTNVIVTVDTYWLAIKHRVMVSAYNKN